LQRLPHRWQEYCSRFGQLDTPIKTAEQRHAQLILERSDLPTNGPVRQAQLVGGGAETQPIRGDLESWQSFQGRQAAHRLSFMQIFLK
jgi:hypothetical protein